MREKAIAMIPARIGSERLKFKNLALLKNKPLIYYAINAAKKSKLFSKIVLNSDDEIFRKIAIRYNIGFYLRPKKIGSSNAKSDDVVYDFLNKFPDNKIIAWVNPIAPLQNEVDLKNIFSFFKKKKLDSLITSEDRTVHAIYQSKPINYKKNEKFKKTQDINPIKLFSYCTMVWNVKSFLKNYKKRKSAIICGNFSVFPLEKYKSVIIKDAQDLKIAENILTNLKKRGQKISYDKILKRYGKKN